MKVVKFIDSDNNRRTILSFDRLAPLQVHTMMLQDVKVKKLLHGQDILLIGASVPPFLINILLKSLLQVTGSNLERRLNSGIGASSTQSFRSLIFRRLLSNAKFTQNDSGTIFVAMDLSPHGIIFILNQTSLNLNLNKA